MNLNPLTALDFYKSSHYKFSPENTEVIYSNLTARSAKLKNVPDDMFHGGTIFFGLQFFIKDFLQGWWQREFFEKPHDEVVKRYQRRMDTSLGKGAVTTEHISQLHRLGYLPIAIKALPEGTLVPIGVPMLVIYNTDKRFAWLTNYLETALSAYIWKTITTATTAFSYRKLLHRMALATGGDTEFVKWQGHDFSARGMSTAYDAAISGMGHLLSFTGTDTVAAIDTLEDYYYADSEKELIGGSVFATEHSNMCSATAVIGEFEQYKRLITEVCPTGIISIVSDTYDYWRVLTDYLPRLKNEIESRDGKVVVRPDCYDNKTQILTQEGWKFFKDLTKNDYVAQVNDEGEQEFVKPLKIVNQEYEGDMYHFHDFHGKVDLVVTPDHRMIYKKKNVWREDTAEKMFGFNYPKQFVRAAKCKNNFIKLTPFERLNIAFQADGSNVTNNENRIRFTVVKQRKIDRILKIVKDCNLKFYKYDLTNGQVEIQIEYPFNKVSKNFDWVNLESLDANWCQEFIEELSYWDSHRRSDTRIKYDTTTPDVLPVLERIVIGAGYGIYISKYVDDRKEHFSDVYTVHIVKNGTIGFQAVEKTKIKYKGTVHCVTVPSGRVLVKRNQCILVSGNSGNPLHIICGDPNAPEGTPERKGSLELLWETFGGTTNNKGYRVLNPKVGLIYGDSITPALCRDILAGMEAKGFASSNVVFGIGSFTYNYTTRDTYGMAVKATYCEVNGKPVEIFKDPVTDKGKTKKSAKGLIKVIRDENNNIAMLDQQRSLEDSGLLETVFTNGHLVKPQSLREIRERIEQQL